MEKPLVKTAEPLGATPLNDEEREGLIPDHITTVPQLNAWEGANILRAESWAFRRRYNLLTDHFVKRLHKKMFDETWKWAGQYRKSDKTIGIAWEYISVQVRETMLNVTAWMSTDAYSTDEIAARLHHRLVWIHPFPNGNGRHARLFADLYLHQAGQPRFTWGSANLHPPSQTRSDYTSALQSADKGDFAPLKIFARSG